MLYFLFFLYFYNYNVVKKILIQISASFRTHNNKPCWRIVTNTGEFSRKKRAHNETSRALSATPSLIDSSTFG